MLRTSPADSRSCGLVWTGEQDWAGYFRQAAKRLPFDRVEEVGDADHDEWQAHAAAAHKSGRNARSAGTCELAVLDPDAKHPGRPQYVVSVDRWHDLGLKTKLALFLQSSGSEHLCPETIVLQSPDDMTLDLQSRVTAATPWVLKGAAGSKGDEVHFVASPGEVQEVMRASETAREHAREALLEFAQFGDVWSDTEAGIEEEGEYDVAYRDVGHVLQRHIDRPMLIEGGRKFTLRTYLLLHAATNRVWTYEHDYEVRLADMPYEQGTENHGDVRQLLTNGSSSSRAWGMDGTAHGAGWRRMASEYSELTEVRPLVREFMAECGRCLLPAAAVAAAPEATKSSKCTENDEEKGAEAQLFELVGLDLMIEDSLHQELCLGDGGNELLPRCWMLEVNCFPRAAPFEEMEGKSQAFHLGMIDFCASLMAMLIGNGVNNHWREVTPQHPTLELVA